MADKHEIQLDSLDAGTNYVVEVRAINTETGRESEWSPKLAFTTDKDELPPNPPDPASTSWYVDGPNFVLETEKPSLCVDDSTEVKDFSHFRVKLYPTGDSASAVIYQVHSERWEFTIDMNAAAFGTPENDITIEIISKDIAGNPVDNTLNDWPGKDPTTKQAVNGVPEFPLDGLNIYGERKAIRLEWNKALEPNNNGTATDIEEYRIFRNGGEIATVGGHTFAFIDADPGRGEHTYFVRAVDYFGQTDDTENESATASGYWEEDILGPDAPTITGVVSELETNDTTGSTAYFEITFDAPTTEDGGAAAYDDHEGFRIRWARSDATAGAYNYMEIVDDRTDPSVAESFTVRIGELKSGQSYDLGVQAFDRYANDSAWDTVTEVTASDTTPPAIPANFALEGGIETIHASWDANTESDLHHYEVYADTTSGFVPDSTNLKWKGLGTSVSWSAAAGENWFAVIRAVDNSNNASDYSTEQSATAAGSGADSTAPAKPTNVAVSSSSYFVGQSQTGRVTATWTAPTASDLAGYHVRLREDGQTDALVISTIDDSQESHTFSGLEIDKTYHFSIEAFDDSGNTSGYTGEVSVTVSGSDAPGTPTMLEPSTGPGMIRWEWTEVTDEDLYDYKIKITGVIG